MEVRSFRRVFDLERRIYRVDRFRLNPSGIPVRGIVYLVLILAATLVLARSPVSGRAVSTIPWLLRYLALPGATATLLTVVRIDGRPFHMAARALLRYRASRFGAAGVPRARAPLGSAPAGRWAPPPILILPDGSDGSARPRRLRYTGPGAVLVAVAHERKSASGPLVRLGVRPDLRVRQMPSATLPARGSVIVLGRRARLSVR